MGNLFKYSDKRWKSLKWLSPYTYISFTLVSTCNVHCNECTWCFSRRHLQNNSCYNIIILLVQWLILVFNFRLQFLLLIKAKQGFSNLTKSTKMLVYLLLGFSAVPVSCDQRPVDKTQAEGAFVIFTCTHNQAVVTSWTVDGQPFENFLGMWETILNGSRLTLPTSSGYSSIEVICHITLSDEVTRTLSATLSIQGNL